MSGSTGIVVDPTKLTYGQKETLFDLSFYLGYNWRELSDELREYIMESIGGSRSLVEMITLWADEFDKGYDAKTVADPDYCEYLSDIDIFFDVKWAGFIAEHVANRIKE